MEVALLGWGPPMAVGGSGRGWKEGECLKGAFEWGIWSFMTLLKIS